jgi:hypothetical protein
MTLLVVLSAISSCLTFNDMAIGVIASSRYFAERLPAMSRAWFELVPEVHIYLDEVKRHELPPLSNHSNCFFHVNTMIAYELVGTEFEDNWNDAQTRHLLHIADLYERCPNKTFYLIVDDDTFVYPRNIVTFASMLRPELPRLYGRLFAMWETNLNLYRKPYAYANFVHGGSGCLYSFSLMKLIAPYLRNCSLIYEMARVPSDMRISFCIDRFTPLNNSEVLVQVPQFHPDHIWAEMPTPGELPVHTFHEVRHEKQVMQLHKSAVSHLDGELIDWSQYSTQPFWVADPGIWLVFGFALCWVMWISTCAMAKTPIMPVNSTVYHFRQEFEQGWVVYIRCDETLREGEVMYFGRAPPPDGGFAVSLRCPERQPWKVYSDWNSSDRWTREEMSEL